MADNTPNEKQVLASFKDQNDLYDSDLPKVRKIHELLTREFQGKRLTVDNFVEMRKRTEDELFKVGIKGTMTLDRNTLLPVMDLQGRIAGASEEKYGLDHERKRHEVLVSKERGEKYMGEKEKPER